MATPAGPPRDSQRGPSHVLVVDDEPLIRWSVSETLRHEGHVVVEAEDAESALIAVRNARSPFAVIVLDVRLPDSDGLSLLARLHRTLAHTRIILMTAHGTPEMSEDALALGAYSVMTKPFGMADIAEMVQQAGHE